MKRINMNKHRLQGFSLIELMIALVIGLIILLALTQIFMSTTRMNVAQNGLARLQENGRFLMLRLKNDIEGVGHQPCASISMESPQYIDQGFALKPFYSAVNLDNGLPVNGFIDPQYFLQGHECDASGTCQPDFNVSPGGNAYNTVPGAGTAAGNRAFQTDVLTMRLINGRGVLVDDSIFPSTDTLVKLEQDPTAEPLNLESGDQIIIGNCYKTLITDAVVQPDNKLSIPNVSVAWASRNSMTQVYNYTKDFETVSYYIGLKTDPSNANNLISSLYRVKNNEAPTEVAEGVERFDVEYGVKFSDGSSGYLTADEIQSASTLECVTPPIPPGDMTVTPMTNNAGCLWRSVFAIRVHVLLNTIYNSTTDAQESYVYSVDGPEDQIPTAIPSGIDPRKMFRREFTQTISLSSVNL